MYLISKVPVPDFIFSARNSSFLFILPQSVKFSESSISDVEHKLLDICLVLVLLSVSGVRREGITKRRSIKLEDTEVVRQTDRGVHYLQMRPLRSTFHHGARWR